MTNSTQSEQETENEKYDGYSTVSLDDMDMDNNSISPLFFPSNIFYKFLPIDFFLTKKRIAPTPMMVEIFRDVEILDVDTAFEMKKSENE